MPELEDFVAKCDWAGALALLDFRRRSGEESETTLSWLAYCAFHMGDYAKALEMYDEIEMTSGATDDTSLGRACCLYFLGKYDEAIVAAKPVTSSSGLRNRLLFHCAQKTSNDDLLVEAHDQLDDAGKADQLSLAAVHYMRSHFQEAIEIYKRINFDHRDDVAVHMYMAMCYYKLDYYDVSLKILQVYLQHLPTSPAAINLKACNHFRLYSGKAAEAELRQLADATGDPTIIDESPALAHNMCIFRGGADASRVLPPLLDSVPEARLNLIVYHLKAGDIRSAHEVAEDLKPTVPVEYIVKAVVHAELGQASGDREQLRLAQQYYQLVGASASECDTVPGRQCMASCFFLLRQFKDVNIYLSSIKPYIFSDNDFNWNYGIAQAAEHNYDEAEKALLQITDERYTSDYVYIAWLARCYVMNGKAKLAWELYLTTKSRPDAMLLLTQLANDCYRMGAFFFAAKAFSTMERYDVQQEYWEGKRGACIGVLQQVIAGEEPKELLPEVLEMLRAGGDSHPQQEHVAAVIAKWCRDNDVHFGL